MNLRTKYSLLKAVTVVIGAMSIPWSTFAGFAFGEGRYVTGLIVVGVQAVVAVVDGYIWFWVLENMKSKVGDDTPKQ